MNSLALPRQLEQALTDVPILDGHTHLTNGRLGARGLHDILLYHMVVSDLYAAGCPSGRRLTEYPGWPDRTEAHARLQEAIPFLPRIRNTSCCWGVRTILRDLYGWDQPVTRDNWQRLDDLIRERADDRAWQREMMQRARIQRFTTEWARREQQADDDILQYSLEWAFFSRCQWGEFDTALYELERCWGREPESPSPIGAGGRPKTARVIQSLDDVHSALKHYMDHIPYGKILSVATHISTDIDFRVVSDAEMAAALQRRPQAGPRERDIYAAFINEAYLNAFEAHADELVFQFSIAAEPLPHETASRINQKTIGQVAEMVGRHPRIQFNAHVSSRHADQSFCTLCRELPNFSLTGYWWHNFFPGSIRQVLENRLDMLPVNKQVGFISDAYCLEWSYAKATIVRNQLAQVLAQKIDQGQYTVDEALSIAHAIFYETSRDLLGMRPAAPFA